MVKVDSYINPEHKLQNGKHCGGKRDRGCNNTFSFCLTTANNLESLVDQTARSICPSGSLTFMDEEDDIMFPVGSEIVPGSNIPNPMIFNMAAGPWPVSWPI